MRLTQRTDIALRALIYLACQCEDRCSVQDMAAVLDVSSNHLQKAVQALAKAGFVDARRGKGGGNRLARPAESISIGEVVRALEPLEPVECFRDDNQCVLTPSCALMTAFQHAMDQFLEHLDGVPISRLGDRPMRAQLLQLGLASQA